MTVITYENDGKSYGKVKRISPRIDFEDYRKKLISEKEIESVDKVCDGEPDTVMISKDGKLYLYYHYKKKKYEENEGYKVNIYNINDIILGTVFSQEHLDDINSVIKGEKEFSFFFHKNSDDKNCLCLFYNENYLKNENSKLSFGEFLGKKFYKICGVFFGDENYFQATNGSIVFLYSNYSTIQTIKKNKPKSDSVYKEIEKLIKNLENVTFDNKEIENISYMYETLKDRNKAYSGKKLNDNALVLMFKKESKKESDNSSLPIEGVIGENHYCCISKNGYLMIFIDLNPISKRPQSENKEDSKGLFNMAVNWTVNKAKNFIKSANNSLITY